MEQAREPGGQTPGAEPRSTWKLVKRAHTVRRSPRGSLVLVGLVLPAFVAAGAGLVSGASAEDSLVADAHSALQAEGFAKVRVEADGPFLTALVPTRVDRVAVDRVLSGIDGVSTVSTEMVYATAKEAKACTNLEAKLNRVTGRQRIPFEGESTRLTPRGASMVRAAGKLVASCGAAKVYVGGHTDSHTIDGSTLSLRRARVMIDLMRSAGAPRDRLVPRGYGAQYPVDEGDSRAAQQRNQRGSIRPVEG